MPPQPGQWGPGNQPPPPPPGYYPPQGGWGGPPPQKSNNTIKWLLAGVGILLVIAITVGVTVLVTRDGSGGDRPSTSTSASGLPIASADDTGPVEIITLEPTCQAWMPVSSAKTKVQNSGGWGNRDPDIPASEWTSAQRTQYETVARNLRETADQVVVFARQTPHRVVRELYEQYIYYARAYADTIPNYIASDNSLAQAHIAAANSLDAICDSVTYGSASSRSPSTSPISPPDPVATPGDPASPTPVVASTNGTCTKLLELHLQFIADSTPWSQEDPNIPASEWTPSRKSASESAARVLGKYADELENLGRGSDSPVFRDLAALGAIYIRAYVNALPTYVVADNYLVIAGTRANNVLVAACRAVAD